MDTLTFLGAPYELRAVDTPVRPSRVSSIENLTVSVALEQRGTADGASVLNEFYLLRDPNDPGSKIAEIGLFAISTESSIAFMDQSESLGRVRDQFDREWVVASTRDSVPFIMFRPSDNSDVLGTVDWRHMLDYLHQAGRISGEEWFTGMAIGPEPRVGEGTMTLSEYNVTYVPLPA